VGLAVNGSLQSQTVVKSLNLANIVALADSGAYGGNRTLSANTAAIALSAGAWLSALENWEGAGYNLTANEIDVISSMVATLEYELSDGANLVQPAIVKIGEVVATSDVSSLLLNTIDSGDFLRYELVIQGLRSDYATAYYDWLILEFNGVSDNSKYASFNVMRDLLGQTTTENPNNYPAIGILGGCAGNDGDLQCRASVRLSIDCPENAEYKTMMWQSSIVSPVSGEMSNTSGSGTFENLGDITSIEIWPLSGTEFEVKPAPTLKPKKLTMSLYGVS